LEHFDISQRFDSCKLTFSNLLISRIDKLRMKLTQGQHCDTTKIFRCRHQVKKRLTLT